MSLAFVERFFVGERHAAWIIAAAGLLSITVASGYFLGALGLRQPFHRGLATSLLLFGLLQLFGGLNYGREMAAREQTVVASLRDDPQPAAQGEVQRMTTGVERLRFLMRFVWPALIVGGLVLLGLTPPRHLLHGIALGVILQCTVNLSIDALAERRAAPYVQALGSLGVAGGRPAPISWERPIVVTPGE